MNWLDLGWLRRESCWEFHPWGPLLRGYQVPEDQFILLRRKVRWVRGSLLPLATVPFLLPGSWTNPWAWVLVASVAGLLEMWAVGVLFGRLQRSETLGWEKGTLYLAKWLSPKLLTVSRILVVALLVLSIVALILAPTSPRAYLLTGFFCGVLFLLNYLQQVQSGR
jgi:hypothetical protein